MAPSGSCRQPNKCCSPTHGASSSERSPPAGSLEAVVSAVAHVSPSTRRRSGRHGARVSKAVAPARLTRVIAVGAEE
jgi:hypothetical protein